MRGVDRVVVRVEDALHTGPDAEVDDKWLYIRPTDPERTDPFLVLSEDLMTAPGFDWHPHQGLETVTYVLDGELEHSDSTGGSGVLRAGDVQWMTAGRGIEHREQAPHGGYAHILQLWLALPAQAEQVPPGYQDLPASARPLLRRPGAEVDVVSGTVDVVAGLAHPARPVQAVLVTLDPEAALDLPVPAADRAFVLVLAGTAVVAGEQVRARQLAWSEPEEPAEADVWSRLALSGSAEGTRLLVVSGRPVGTGAGTTPPGAGEPRS